MVKTSGQILVFTVLILLIVSLAVIGITSTARNNSLLVQSNIEYNTSYNASETEILKYSNQLSDITTETQDFLADGLGDLTCESDTAGLICGRSIEDGNRRIVLRIFETNIVENYNLNVGGYFDVILSDSQNSQYRDRLELRWFGDTSYDLELIYFTGTNPTIVKSARQVIDIASIYKQTGRGFLTVTPELVEGNLIIDLSLLNSQIIPSDARLDKLRIRSISRSFGSTLTVRPIATQGQNLPNQVRRIEAFTYRTSTPESPSPVVLSQFPLSPEVAAPLLNSIATNALKTAICGNGVIEGAETCDDGGNGKCPGDCRFIEICGFVENATRQRGDFFKSFPIKSIKGDYFVIDAQPLTEPDFIEIVAIRNDGTKEILQPGGCFGGVQYGGSYPGFGKKFTRTFDVVPWVPTCTVENLRYTWVPILVKENWISIDVTIKNTCGGNQSKWNLITECVENIATYKPKVIGGPVKWHGWCPSTNVNCKDRGVSCD